MANRKNNKKYKYKTFEIDLPKFKKAIASGKSFLGVAKTLGCHTETVRKYASINDIDTSHLVYDHNRIDCMGKTFGRLLVIAEAPRRKDGCIAWLCICECKNEVEVRTAHLVSGITKSCGCFRDEEKIKAITKYHPSVSSAITIWKSTYSDRDISFELFVKLSQMNCYYCNIKPNTTFNKFLCDSVSSRDESRKDGYFTYNGLDRIDNSIGHSINNCVICCSICNYAKNDYDIEFFRSHLKKMVLVRDIKLNGNFENIIIPSLKLEYNKSFLPRIIPKREAAIKLCDLKPGHVVGKLKVLEVSKDRYCICVCECGDIKRVDKYEIVRNGATSCGKSMCKGRYTPYIATAREKWIFYKKDGLLFEEFFELSQMNCTYCETPPSNCFNVDFCGTKVPFIYSGLDRLNSSKGHTIDNVVPACITCNMMKSDHSLTDFNNWLTAINNYWLIGKSGLVKPFTGSRY